MALVAVKPVYEPELLCLHVRWIGDYVNLIYRGGGNGPVELRDSARTRSRVDTKNQPQRQSPCLCCAAH